MPGTDLQLQLALDFLADHAVVARRRIDYLAILVDVDNRRRLGVGIHCFDGLARIMHDIECETSVVGKLTDVLRFLRWSELMAII